MMLPNNIFSPAKREDKELEVKENEYYTYLGYEDFLDDKNHCRLKEDNDNTLAKKIYRDDGTYKLMIKCDLDYKPFDPENQIASSLNKIKNQNNNKLSFHTVGHKAFNNYLKFLQTKNKSWLLNTEREMT